MKPAAVLFLIAAAGAAIWMFGPWGEEGRTGKPHGALPSQTSPVNDRSNGEEITPANRSVVQRIMNGGMVQMSAEQIGEFVAHQNRSPESLIAAFDLGGDEMWLDAAAAEHPDNPKVAVAMLLHAGIDDENAGEWIRSLLENAPDNAVGNLYAARAAFASGDAFNALVELKAMGDADGTDFFTLSARDTMIAAYQHAGYSDVEAKVAAFSGVKIPSGEMSKLNTDIAAAMSNAHINGDPELARSLGEAGLSAAKRTAEDGTTYLITRLIGFAMQRKVLDQMDELDLIPGGNKELVVERIASLDGQLEEIRELLKQSTDLLPTMTDEETESYFDMVGSDGEMAAMRWLISNREREK